MRLALSKVERIAYGKAKADCRKAVEGVKANFRILGERLKAIRDGDWWREEFESWTEFCREELPFGQGRADQLIRAVEIGAGNERQARELLGLQEEEREAVMTIAEASGRPTSAKIKTAREELEELTAGLTGDAKADLICELVERAEQAAAAKLPVTRDPPPAKDRRAAVKRLVDRALDVLRIAKKEWRYLSDVAEKCDVELSAAVRLLEGIKELAKASAV